MSYVNYKTIFNSVGGALSNPNESKICKIGKHKVFLTRLPKLNKYGNPVHSATYIHKDGSLGPTYKSVGSATLVVSGALRRVGIFTRYPK